jgi:hypothetical protein
MSIRGPHGEAISMTERFSHHILQDHRDYDTLVTETVPDWKTLTSIPYTIVVNAEVKHAERLLLNVMGNCRYFQVDDVESPLLTTTSTLSSVRLTSLVSIVTHTKT